MKKNQMSPTRIAVLDYAKNHDPIHRDELAAALGVAECTVSVHLKALVRAGTLHKYRVGSSRCAWSMAPKPAPVMPVRPPLAQHRLQPHEQASSVWDYARRCAA